MQTTAKSKKELCTPKASAVSARTISLPLIDPLTGMKKSRAGKWRFYVLAGVHVVMIAHFVHWLWAGQTFTPIEPSEAKDLIWNGEVNLGFVFFGLAILSTLILGRWVCGWGCHLIAYQDLTLWVLKKLHLRPKPFRTRFLFKITTLVLAAGWLYFVPLGFRLWSMFLGHEQPPVTMHLTRTGYWDTFPGPLFAVLSVLIAGVAIVYFLGPKGFCTYACPYGAIFAISDRIAPARIRVTDACNQCGHCTASCTSNVNVAEEVKLFKMVVDPGCMKCLDCVEVCPNDALYVGMGRPAAFSKPVEPRKEIKYDLTVLEEIFSLAIFVFVLVTVNGLYGEFPYLLSLAVAGIVTFLFMKGARMLYAPDAMMQRVVLKTGGRYRPAGTVMMVTLALLAGLLFHSAVWRYHDLMASNAFESAPLQTYNWQYDASSTKQATAGQLSACESVAAHTEAMQKWGLFDVPAKRVNAAWAMLFLDRGNDALEQMRAATQSHPGYAGFWLWRAKIEIFLGMADAARESFERAIEAEAPDREWLASRVPNAKHPMSAEIWSEWGRFLLSRGETERGGDALLKAVEFDPAQEIPRLMLIDYYLSANQVDRARGATLDAIHRRQESPAIYMRLESIRQVEPSSPQIIAEYKQALTKRPDNVAIMNNLATALTGERQFAEAIEICRDALGRAPESPGIRATLAATMLAQQDVDGAIKEYEILRKIAPESGEAAIKLGILYANVGRTEDAKQQLKEALRIGTPQEQEAARQLLHELAQSMQPPGKLP